MSRFTDARDNVVAGLRAAAVGTATGIKNWWDGLSPTGHALLTGLALGFIFGVAFGGWVLC